MLNQKKGKAAAKELQLSHHALDGAQIWLPSPNQEPSSPASPLEVQCGSPPVSGAASSVHGTWKRARLKRMGEEGHGVLQQ